MPSKTRKFAQLSPQKQRQSPAKFVRLTEHDEQDERLQRTVAKIAQGHERAKSIVELSSPRKTANLLPNTPSRANALMLSNPSTPTIKMPILANFEEWMKMATDNKINAGNSWNFALIDYFHEMSLLKEGNSINFQKASVTLDGCVKIYTNRVDSVATETGKLLSGLSSRKENDSATDGLLEEDDEEGGEIDDDGKVQRTKKKSNKTGTVSTLVKDFTSIQARKLDMEFFVDPLFKKTSAEFDEGGARGLLLNHLCVDHDGRIIFDASDASSQAVGSGDGADDQESPVEDPSIDIEALGAKFFPELFTGADEDFENLHICPFLKDFKSDSPVLDIPLLPTPTHGQLPGEADDMPDFDPDNLDYNGPEGTNGLHDVVDVFDDNENAGFGEVNEIVMPFSMNQDEVMKQQRSPTAQKMRMTSESGLSMQPETEAMYLQFDHLLRKNWTGPSNWKISRLNIHMAASTAPTAKKPRKEKQVTTIDFFDTDSEVNEEDIFTKGGASINLPKTQWSSKSRNLLPEDKHFNSQSLLCLFLKPKARFGQRRQATKLEDDSQPDNEQFVHMDENFWAKQNQSAESQVPDTYDANFFHDGEDLHHAPLGDDEDDDNDAFEDAKQDFDVKTGTEADFGSQLQLIGKKLKPEYVNYAKAAKKVDVKVLKENIWDKLELVSADANDQEQLGKSGSEERKFTEVVKSLGDVYAERAMSEISTSFCFICLLHLANEKGLEIKGADNMRELTVRRDETVVSIDAV